MQNISQSLTPVLAAETNPLIPDVWEMLITAIGFFILLFIVMKKISPMYNKMYQDRVDAIEGGLAKAEKAQREADQNLKQYKAQLAQAQQEANEIREEARAQGVQILEEMKAKATAESQRISDQGQQQLQAEREKVVQSLRGEIGGLATNLAGKIVGESLQDDNRSTRVVDRFLENLDATSPADKVS
ncbi:MAG: F0F1 ATP synthase subunit B [Micrococcaceae bacterium]